MKFRKLSRQEIYDAFRSLPSYFPCDYPHECPWCSERRLDEDEEEHLKDCQVFNTLPVAEVVDGKPFIRLPGTEILVERFRKC